MSLPPIANTDNDDLLQHVTPPSGWFTDEELPNAGVDAYTNPADFVNTVNKTLPQAARWSEELIGELEQRLDIEVYTVYLTIEPDAAYHIFLLVSQDDYHSPHMQAAQLLIEKFTNNAVDFSIRFTFTVAREHIMSYLSTDRYKLKYVRSVERSTPSLPEKTTEL